MTLFLGIENIHITATAARQKAAVCMYVCVCVCVFLAVCEHVALSVCVHPRNWLCGGKTEVGVFTRGRWAELSVSVCPGANLTPGQGSVDSWDWSLIIAALLDTV